MLSRFFGPHFTAALAILIGTLAAAQQPPPAGAVPQQARPGGGRGPRGATPLAYEDYTGFTKLWDGESLKGWSGETDVWSVDNGAIYADTARTPGEHHIYYSGPGAVMRDFHLKVELRMTATGAGGIQYRGRLLHPAHGGSVENPLGKDLPAGVTTMAQAIAAGVTAAPAAPSGGNAGRGAPAAPNPWQVAGYQFDLSGDNRFTGQLYENRGRNIVNLPGGIVVLQPGRVSSRLGNVTTDPASFVKPHMGLAGEWNQVEIIARGSTLVHMINGQVIAITIDDNPADRAYQGIMSLQAEGSGQLWFRNIYVRNLDKPLEFPK